MAYNMFTVSDVLGKDAVGPDEKEHFDATISSKMENLYNKMINNEISQSRVRFLGSDNIKTPNKKVDVGATPFFYNLGETLSTAAKSVIGGSYPINPIGESDVKIEPALTNTGPFSALGRGKLGEQQGNYHTFINKTAYPTGQGLGGYLALDPRLPDYRNIGSSKAALSGPLSLAGTMGGMMPNIRPSPVNAKFNVRPFDLKKKAPPFMTQPVQAEPEMEAGCCMCGKGREEELLKKLNDLPTDIQELVKKFDIVNIWTDEVIQELRNGEFTNAKYNKFLSETFNTPDIRDPDLIDVSSDNYGNYQVREYITKWVDVLKKFNSYYEKVNKLSDDTSGIILLNFREFLRAVVEMFGAYANSFEVARRVNELEQAFHKVYKMPLFDESDRFWINREYEEEEEEEEDAEEVEDEIEGDGQKKG